MKIKDAEEKVKMGFLAIGGREWLRKFCECDPDVGHVPCQYCAEHDALITAEKFVERFKNLRNALMALTHPDNKLHGPIVNGPELDAVNKLLEEPA